MTGLAVAAIPVWCVMAISMALTPITVGLFILPEAIRLQRLVADAGRRLAARRLGTRIPGGRPALRPTTIIARNQAILGDRATWRTFAWLLVQVGAGIVCVVCAVVPFVNTWVSTGSARLTQALLVDRRQASTAETPIPQAPATGGHGLRGIAERVDMLGGVLQSGVTAQGGFEIHVRIPLPDGVGSPSAASGTPAAPNDGHNDGDVNRNAVT